MRRPLPSAIIVTRVPVMDADPVTGIETPRMRYGKPVTRRHIEIDRQSRREALASRRYAAIHRMKERTW